MKTIKRFSLCAVLALPLLANAVAINFSQVPLATKSTPVKPNVMLLIDDSGSMGSEDGTYKNYGKDVFYTPGYDFNRRYACADGANIIEPDPDKYVTAYIDKVYSKKGATLSDGVAYFEYGLGNFYELNENPSAASVVNSNSHSTTPACFEPNGLYRVQLKADKCEGKTRTGNIIQECTVKEKECLNYITTSEEVCETKYWWGIPYEDCDTITSQVCTAWSEEQSVCVEKHEELNPWIDYEYCTADDQSIITYDGNFLNWYFSKSSNEYYDFDTTEIDNNDVSGGIKVDLTSPDETFKVSSGYKKNTGEKEQRMKVAKDVASLLVAGTKNMNIGLASFANGSGGEIDSELLELNNLSFTGVDATETSVTKANRKTLLQRVDWLEGNGGTPLAESMAAVAEYYAHGSKNKVLLPAANNKKDNVDKNYKPSELFESSKAVKVNRTSSSKWQHSDVKSAKSLKAPIKSDTFCRKNFLVTMTDGEPSSDGDIGTGDGDDIRTWITGIRKGTDNFTYKDERANDVAAAIFDIDFRPDIKDFTGNPVINNVTTYSIGFGDDVTNPNEKSYKFLADIALKGGGEFFAASSGTELAAAFNAIKKDILSGEQSLSSVALSAVAELRTSNLSFKASYETSKWSGDLQAFFVNEDGLFQNASIVNGSLVGTGTATGSTENIAPVWNTASLMNQMYVVETSPLYRSTDKRKIYTRGKAGYNAEPFTYSNLSNLPAGIQADIAVKAGANAGEAEDLMNFIRGDVSHESRNPKSSTSKYRSRVNISLNNQNKIDSVSSGSILGTVVNSAPVYLSESGRPWHDQAVNGKMAYGEDVNGKRYSDFKEYNKVLTDGTQSRPPMVYFGGNDGMLHAITVNGFDTGTDSTSYPAGSELWAYAPSFIASTDYKQGFNYLASPRFDHRYYVDARPTISEVYWDHDYSGTGTVTKEWRSILVSGVGAAGKGFFALDVTCPLPRKAVTDNGTCADEPTIDPTKADDLTTLGNNILWEFTKDQDNNMGFTFSNPVIAKVDYDSGKTTDPNGNGNGRWAVIANNGYGSETGKAVLYIIFIDGASSAAGDNTWTEGVDYLVLHASEKGIRTPSSIDTAGDPDAKPKPIAENANGLSSPAAVDIDNDGLVDRIYAGDIKGQMWVFNVQSDASTNVRAGVSNYTTTGFPWSVHKLTQGEPNQAITTAPRVQRNTDLRAAYPNVMVMFATGMYLQDADIQETSPAFELQAVYGVHDRGDYDLDVTSNVTDKNGATRNLLEQRYWVDVDVTTASGDTVKARTLVDKNGVNGSVYAGNPTEIDWSSQYGWMTPLYSADQANPGSSSGKLKGERVVYNPLLINEVFTFTSIIPTNATCAGGLSSYTLAFSWKTGLPPEFAIFDIDQDGKIESTPGGLSAGSDLGLSGTYSELGAGESSFVDGNLFTTINNNIQSQKQNTGAAVEGTRLGWEEKLPFGVQP